MKNGYWQVALTEKFRILTAFLFDSALYHFNRIPFGLKTAGSILTRVLRIVLSTSSDRLRKSIRIYVDIFIATLPVEQHLLILGELFGILSEFNFTVNFSKCEFFQSETKFLAFIITAGGIVPDYDKVADIRNFEEPKNQEHLQSFLGLCNYYRFVLKYINFIGPFRDLLSKHSFVNGENSHRQAFVSLKENFIETVCICQIIPNAVFKVQTDASDVGIEGVIYQLDDNNEHRIISVASRCLSEVEYKYTTTEKELLAVVCTIFKFRYYLIGIKFEIITDHKSLVFLHSTMYYNSRLIRWSLFLQQFSYEISYC